MRAGRVEPDPAPGDVARDDEISGFQRGSPLEDALEQRGREGERGIGDDAERAAGQPKIACVRLHDDDVRARETAAQDARPHGVQLDRDDASARCEERCGQATGTGADVENDVTGHDAGVVDDPTCPALSELVPSPARPRVRGHGAPSPWSSRYRRERGSRWTNEYQELDAGAASSAACAIRDSIRCSVASSTLVSRTATESINADAA
jgi:hypothetical protein